MQYDAPIYMNDGTLRPVFRAEDYDVKSGYVTFNDLLKYANLNNVNTFLSLNLFAGGLRFSQFINDVSVDALNYVKNVTSDIQGQFNTIFNSLQNFFYDDVTDTQGFYTTTGFQKIVSNDIENNNLINNSIITNAIQTNNINSVNIRCNTIKANNIPAFFINNYPVISSGLISKLTGITLTNCLISVMPNYTIRFYDGFNIIKLTCSNTTNDVIYFTNVNLSNIVSFVIFK